jgi:hypothetical protein
VRTLLCCLLVACLASVARAQETPATEVVWKAKSIPSRGSHALPDEVDVSRCDRLELAVSPGASGRLRVRFREADRAAYWYREVSAPAGAWTELSLPLRWFRPGRGATPRWEDVRRISVTSESSIRVRDVRLVSSGREHAAYPGAQALREIAFPRASSARLETAGRFALLTDDPALRTGDVLAELGRMETRLLGELPAPHPGGRPVVLLVFEQFDGYRAFWLRYFDLCGLERPPWVPRSGLSVAGIASTWRHEKETGSRPRYVHEGVHALLAVTHGIGNDGSWLQEGLAQREAWRSAGGRRPVATIYAGLADEARRSPLAGLLDGSAVTARAYWQVALLVDWMLADETRRDGLRAFLGDVRTRGGEPQKPLLEARLGAKAPEIEQRWLRDMRERYPPDDD